MEDIYILNNLSAYKKGSPIYNPQQMNKTISWNKMDKEWLSSRTFKRDTSTKR